MAAPSQTQIGSDDNDLNVVELWLRKDPIRWMAGILAGAFSGLMMLAFAMTLCVVAGVDVWYPIKVAAMPVFGGAATEYGFQLSYILTGIIVVEAVSAILGLAFAQFTGTNSMGPLLAMGLVWGAFSWIFLFNLFMPAFGGVFAAQLSSGTAFPIILVYGLSYASVAFFDRALRGKKD